MTDIPETPALAAMADPDTLAGSLLSGARKIVEFQAEGSKLSAFVAIGIYEDGQFSMGFRFDPDHPFLGRSLLVAFVKEIIEREMTATFSAEEYVKNNLL